DPAAAPQVAASCVALRASVSHGLGEEENQLFGGCASLWFSITASGSGAASGSFSAVSTIDASLASPPAVVAAAQASADKGTGETVGLASSVETATASTVSAAGNCAPPVCHGGAGMSLAGEFPWNASSRQSVTSWLGSATFSRASSRPPGRQGACSESSPSSCASSSSSPRAPHFRSSTNGECAVV